MSKIEVVYASRHGGTEGIARRIGEVLTAAGLDVDVADAGASPSATGFDAYVVGSGVYMGSWLKEGTDWLERHASALASHPVWLFSSGPLPGSTKSVEGSDPIAEALGPADGPGSGGRKKVEALSAEIHPRDHRVFKGAFDPTEAPKAMSERFVRLMPAAKRVLPTGDFREWDLIEGWAREIAAELRPAAG